MDILSNLEENIVYEVLISTCDCEDVVNIKPFGVKYEDNHFILNLFPNKTLLNIKKTGKLTIHFTQDVLLFTESLLGVSGGDDLQDNVSYSISCEVSSIGFDKICDDYGKNVTTKIIANVVDIIKVNEKLPLMNRSTNQILELLVDFSRYHLMDVDARTNFHKKLSDAEEIIQKTGNEKHKKAIQLIKKEVKSE